MKSMVDRFDKVKAKNDALKVSIMYKDVDIVGLVTRIMGKYEKATFKAHYNISNAFLLTLMLL